MKIAGAWLQAAGCQNLLGLLTTAGYAAYAVGGCVRNALLGAPVADVDIASNALPEAVITLARNAGMKVIPTGLAHGTVTVISDGESYEVTSFRQDVQTDGRRAVVAFAQDIRQDAARRDFTMNALYARADGTVLDPLGRGLADARDRNIRFVGEPEARIREDYLRILRFFRFSAHYGDPDAGIDREGLAACAAEAAGIDSLSRERIGAELRRLLGAPDPAPALAAMQSSGVLQRCLPGADASAMAVLVHLEADLPPRWQRRLALLGGMDLTKALRLSRAEAADLEKLRHAVSEGPSAAALGHELGLELARDAVLARAALLGQPPPPDWQAELARGAKTPFPLCAADLMPEYQGVALGLRLRQQRQYWLAQDLWPNRTDLLALPPA